MIPDDDTFRYKVGSMSISISLANLIIINAYRIPQLITQRDDLITAHKAYDHVMKICDEKARGCTNRDKNIKIQIKMKGAREKQNIVAQEMCCVVIRNIASIRFLICLFKDSLQAGMSMLNKRGIKVTFDEKGFVDEMYDTGTDRLSSVLVFGSWQKDRLNNEIEVIKELEHLEMLASQSS